jgi:hypothetical protein
MTTTGATMKHSHALRRHGAYEPPLLEFNRLPETRPRVLPISPLFAFWIGFAAGGAAVGMTVALFVGPM